MIERYTTPKMKAIWSEENQFNTWLEIEILACEANEELGNIPAGAAAEVRAKAAFDVARINEIEEEVQHDVIAFLTDVGEHVGASAKFIHYGLTSSDVVDTALSVLMRQAIEVIIDEGERLTGVLEARAKEHKDTVTIGRTHGIHAEPTTFGLKLLGWAFEMRRNLDRLKDARDVISVGKISGAVGTYSSVDPAVERFVCEKLGLKPAEVSTQVVPRDLHAVYMARLGIVASSLERFATEIRALQRTEVLEVLEPFGKGQKGSSAMPHKRNPVICERICGLARLVRANALPAMENVALWHERDISHSSVERIIIPDSTTALHYMLVKMRQVIEGMTVYTDRMKQNIELTRGLVFSQRVLLKLVEQGMSREDAYGLVQRHAMAVWEGDAHFKDVLAADDAVTKVLTPEELEGCFQTEPYLAHVDEIFARLQAREGGRG